MIKNISNNKVSVALIGVGNICQNYHVPCLKLANSSIKYAVDPDTNALSRLQTIHPEVLTFQNISELSNEMDCAIISSPTAFHAEQVQMLCEKKLHVLCEKPLACSRNEANRLVRIAKQNDIVLQVGYYRRFHYSSQRIRQLLRSGELGIPLRCLMTGGWILNASTAPISLMDKALSGGGVLIDFGVHLIDRLLSWFDSITLERYMDDNEGGMEANAIVTLLGCIGSRIIPIKVVLSRTHDLGFDTYIDFEKALVICNHNIGHQLTVLSPALTILGHETQARVTIPLEKPQDTLSYFSDQWAEFVMRMKGYPEQVSSLEDSLKTTELIEECYMNRQKLSLPWESAFVRKSQ